MFTSLNCILVADGSATSEGTLYSTYSGVIRTDVLSSQYRYAHFPFAGGPRLCIGSNFAMMEAQLVLATIAQRYQLRLVPGHPVEPQMLVTLRPKYGLRMTIRRR